MRSNVKQISKREKKTSRNTTFMVDIIIKTKWICVSYNFIHFNSNLRLGIFLINIFFHKLNRNMTRRMISVFEMPIKDNYQFCVNFLYDDIAQ